MDIDDLEKQLGLSDENLNNDKTNEELEDIINLLNSSEEDIINIQNDSEIFEGLSQEELDMLMQEDAEIDINDIDTDPMSDISIYADEKPLTEELKESISSGEDEEENQEDGQDSEELSDQQDEEYEEDGEDEEQTMSEEDFLSFMSEDGEDEQEEPSQEDENVYAEQNDEPIEEQIMSEEDFLNFMEIPEGEGEFLEFVEAPKKGKKQKKAKKPKNAKKDNSKGDKPSILIIGSIIFLITLIIITIIFFTVAIKKANSIAVQNQIDSDNALSKYRPEDKNTVYFDMAKNIDDETIILEKVHIGQKNTTFYFKNKIDLIKYNITLTDAEENLYPMDLNFTVDGHNKNNTILRFDSIIGNKKGLKLIFESLSTGEKTEFNLSFDATLEPEQTTYINSRIKNYFEDYSININYSEFGENYSRIDYTIEPIGNANYQMQQGNLNEKDYIKLKEGEEYVGALADKPVAYSIDNKIIGRMDFESVENTKGDVIIQFDNIYKKYPINEKFSLSQIRNGNISYDFGKYRVKIEGMHKFDNKYVLVLHTQDTSISTEGKSPNSNRVETKLDVEMIATDKNGVDIIISPTEVRSASYGTDIIFDLDEQQMSILRGISTNNISVNLKSALLKEKSATIPLSLNRGLDRQIVSHEIMEKQISQAFESRLKGKNYIDLTNNTDLIKEYTPLMGKVIKSDLTFVSKNLDNDQLEAIVQESIQIKEEGKTKVVYKNHKIKAKYENDKWTIYFDEIIK